MLPSRPPIWQRVAAALLLGGWALAAGFFAIVGWRAAQAAVAGSPALGHIADVRGALVTTAYSLGGAAVLLGVTALALPVPARRRLAPLAGLWLAVTGFLLAMRRVDGGPLVLAALTALGIAGVVVWQLLQVLRRPRSPRPT